MATKQNNFYLQYQLAAKAGKNADRKAFLRKAAPGAIIVAGCMLAWGGVFLHTAMMRAIPATYGPGAPMNKTLRPTSNRCRTSRPPTLTTA